LIASTNDVDCGLGSKVWYLGTDKSVIMARLCELGHWFEDEYVYNALQRLIKEASDARTWRMSMQNGIKRFSLRTILKTFLLPRGIFFKRDREAGSANHGYFLLRCSWQGMLRSFLSSDD